MVYDHVVENTSENTRNSSTTVSICVVISVIATTSLFPVAVLYIEYRAEKYFILVVLSLLRVLRFHV